MMLSEFVERTGFEPLPFEYEKIEEAYYNFDGDKDAFCKAFVEGDGERKIYQARGAEIDRLNILRATCLAMNRAYAAMLEQGLPGELLPALALVDGNRDPGLPIPTRTVVKGDGKSAAIAAASVLAKVSRDRYMLELDQEYPQYQLAKHKGYPTKLHYELIEKHGVSPIHRRSFLRKVLQEKEA